MSIDPLLTLASFGIGIVVGLTGMGGGALMTPVLVLFFGIPPLTAVSSDLVAAAVMKPVGSFVHFRRGTVNLRLVGWLCVGSVPSAFCGVLIIKSLGGGEKVQHGIQVALGVALMVAALGLFVRAYLRLVERARARDGSAAPLPRAGPGARAHPADDPGRCDRRRRRRHDVGRFRLADHHLADGAVPDAEGQPAGRHRPACRRCRWSWSAALGHILFGDFQLGLTASLLIGSIPGVWIGAQMSSRAPGGIVRRALAFVLLASALKLLGVPTPQTGAILVLVLLVAPAGVDGHPPPARPSGPGLGDVAPRDLPAAGPAGAGQPEGRERERSVGGAGGLRGRLRRGRRARRPGDTTPSSSTS